MQFVHKLILFYILLNLNRLLQENLSITHDIAA